MNRVKLLSARDICGALGISKFTLYRLINTGQIQGYKIGGVWRFAEEDLDAYLEHTRTKVRTPYYGRLFQIWVLTKYHQAPQKYQITKKGQIGWLSLREEYLKGLSSADRAREEFKPVKYRKVRLPPGDSAILVSPRYFAHWPEAHQKEWLKLKIKTP